MGLAMLDGWFIPNARTQALQYLLANMRSKVAAHLTLATSM